MAYSSLTGDPNKGAVPPGEYNLLQDLYSQWQALTGYTLELSDANLLAMANANIIDLTEFGQLAMTLVNTSNFPWANFGLTHDGFFQATESLATVWEQLTGEQMSMAQMEGGGWAPLYGQAMTEHLTASEFRERIMNDTNMVKTYGWLQYGLSYDDFKLQKLQMHTAFGRDLSSDEAIQQLRYFHTNQGPNFSVTAQRQQQPQRTTEGESVVR